MEAKFQRRGYGKPLMLKALEAAAAAGYKQVSLTVHPENGARFMYEQCGFKYSGLWGTYHLMVTSVA